VLVLVQPHHGDPVEMSARSAYRERIWRPGPLRSSVRHRANLGFPSPCTSPAKADKAVSNQGGADSGALFCKSATHRTFVIIPLQMGTFVTSIKRATDFAGVPAYYGHLASCGLQP
jgi:hypothetical protein